MTEAPVDPAQLIITTSKAVSQRATFDLVDIKKVMPDPDQPRKTFNQQKLEELKDSLEERGMLQPVTVRVDREGQMIIMYGERRWRAAQLAEWPKIPVIVRHDILDSNVLADQLAENDHREDLHPIDEARGIRAFMRVKKIATYAEAAKRLGHKSNVAWVTNRIALLDLDESDQQRVIDGTLSVIEGARIAREKTGKNRQSSAGPHRSSSGIAYGGTGFADGDPPPAGFGSSSSSSRADRLPGINNKGTPVQSARVKDEPFAPAEWFSDDHPLAGRARGRCIIKHQRRKTLPGGVACAECWERAVRRDERLNPTEDA